MATIHILSDRFIKFDTGVITVGGIQTYIKDLSEVAHDMGFDVVVYDIDPKERVVTLEHCKVVGINVPDNYKGYEQMAGIVYDRMPDNGELVIYDSDDRIAMRTRFRNVISLQHGVSWDMPDVKRRSLLRSLLSVSIRDYVRLRRYWMIDGLVCVDYNFGNWYRTIIHNKRVSLKVVPNYTRVAKVPEKPAGVTNIIFARRLRKYRGTEVFTYAIKRILEKYDNITVTIAGDGPEKPWMQEMLKGYGNVSFKSFAVGESLDVHADKHIAIVPTVGSEGTSLSLLEAMSSQCAVIASDVGGMTNIILDGFNGLMVPAGDVDALYCAIKKLLDCPEDMRRLGNNAYETVKQCFSHERWVSQWQEIITSYTR